MLLFIFIQHPPDPKKERPLEVISDEVDVHAPPSNVEKTTVGDVIDKKDEHAGKLANVCQNPTKHTVT